ncbi:hypothetical protein A2230_05205 [candidate division WOR-1 bacterium RIFOXYA2_FULL_36_21]|uniref:POTRA domain-containing protein n=1 Tax=candidate division WOR-1 bacterium RIFOXYB2_FULL_36_35 TaxID=1802578 RepID=A0A1F4S3J4_UNCSA|nr:MAG: hypothetical protein A2230_05205 [candidate division WOR-1 bacterium RIFOXYA2_FULL_36_21]OGC14323.1 MAG: hypothetical protein A2290_08285 [candidate division WOR-1 bacterium RIFOXYB2_FULL_36_35]OGC19645.1 MAG: hypothetical protein A2282_02800 [candidate division WOR-1 bacterium RIFOXYA12_FULL_36_13]
MKKLLLVVFILFFFFGVSYAVNKDDLPVKITALVVSGNFHIKTDQILGVVFSKVGDSLDEEKVQNDLKAIYALGYFDDVKVDFKPYLDGSKIIYKVVENPILEKINIKGNTVYSTAEVLHVMGVSTGESFNYKDLREGIKLLNLKYKDDGYILARVVDVNQNKGVLNVDLIEGIVEGVSLEGNESTLDYVILREMNTNPGSIFNEEVFGKDLRRIFNLGFFSEIVPAFEPGSSSDKIILVLKIKEARSNTVNFGGGYGEKEGWFGFVDLSINNLMGTAQGLLIRGQFGQELTTYQFKYTNPWFLPERLGPRTSYTLKLWNTMGTDVYLTQQDEWHVGWDMTFGRTIREIFGSSISFGSERVEPRNGATFEAYTSNFIGYSFSLDTRDYWMNPTSGVYNVLSIREGWKYTGVQTNYLKLGIDLNGFIPLAQNQVLAGHAGFGIGFGDVPIGELYWAGGPNTVRGFSLDETRRGIKKMIFNVEYRYTFNETFQGVVFYDLGNAWDVGSPVPSDFIYGWGPGIRFNTPLGPIRLDYGLGSGKDSGQGILHFSIGQAF